MLGEQISELKEQITGSRVLDAEGPSIEASGSASGNVRGTPINESRTFNAKPLSVGVLHGLGQGVMMGGDSEMATFTGEGLGRITATRTNWRGVFFYRTASTDKLSFLNNVVGVFEVEVDSEGNFTEKVWEWK